MTFDIIPFVQQELVFTSTLDDSDVDQFFATYEAPKETLTCTHLMLDRDEARELGCFFASVDTEEIYWLAKRIKEFVDGN